MNAKKAHIGANGVTPCMRRVSAHVRHSMPWVVSREKFLMLRPEQQCAKCRARMEVEEGHNVEISGGCKPSAAP